MCRGNVRLGILLITSFSVAAVLGASASQAQDTAVAPVTWDLAQEYPSEAAWSAASAEVEARAANFAMLRSVRISHASQLADLLDECAFLRGRASNLAQLAYLRSVFDKTDTSAKARFDAASGLEARVEGAVSWLDRAISQLASRRKLGAWRQSEPRLRHHGWALNLATRRVGHNYPSGGEAAYAATERAATMPSQIYHELMASDLGWARSVDERGKASTLDPAVFATLASSRQTAVRRAAFDAYYARLKTLEQPLGELITRKYEIDRLLARARNFQSGTDSFLAFGSDGIPPGTFQRMIEVTRANRGVIARYAHSIARLNNMSDIGYADLAVATPDLGRSFTLEESEALAIDSLAPLGAPYQQMARQRLASPWFDFASRPNKDAAALGLYWQVGPGRHPYGMVSYVDNYRGSRAIAAMAALTMFFTDLPPDKTPVRREQDFPIYGNSIWYLGGMLHFEHLLAEAGTRQERIGLLAGDLRRVFDEYVRGVVATDFEARLEEAVASGKPPSGAQVTQLYFSVLHDYYDGALQIAEASGEEWMTLGLLYYAHVLDEWAFAMAGAVGMMERVKAHDANAIAAITSPMMKARSFTSYDLLCDAGADPTRASFYEPIFRRMNADMDALDTELERAPTTH
jgi:oligoendopeptidase F